MPELPEVETIRRDLTKAVLDKKISGLQILKTASIKSSLSNFKRVLLKSRFKNIDRIGKLLIFELPKDNFLLCHLKMTGQLIYADKTSLVAGGHSLSGKNLNDQVGGTLPNKATRIVIDFTDGSHLFFNDQRRFGYLKIVDGLELEKIKETYGIEPLQANFTLPNFIKALKRHKNIKAVLLDQSLIAGIGNIYADEALFDARLNPARSAESLSLADCRRLLNSIKKLITKAITERGTTFNNYRDGAGGRGNFVKFLKVYGRKDEHCPRCRGPIKKIKLAGRGTHYCPNCQK